MKKINLSVTRLKKEHLEIYFAQNVILVLEVHKVILNVTLVKVKRINLYKTAFEVQKRDRAYALENFNTCFMTVDLQQTMPLPKLSTSKVFYLRQIWFYNFGIHTITSENRYKPFMFSWTEEVAGKGSNEVGSCLMYFTQLSQLTFQQNIKHLIIWSDSCLNTTKTLI